MKTSHNNLWLALAALVLLATFSCAYSAENRRIVQLENEKPGTTDWLLTKIKKGSKPPRYEPENEPYEKGWRHRKELEGFVSHTSIRAGETLKISVSTDPVIQYRFDLYRLGYYGGKGGRLVKSFGQLQISVPLQTFGLP